MSMYIPKLCDRDVDSVFEIDILLFQHAINVWCRDRAICAKEYKHPMTCLRPTLFLGARLI
eukprot:12422344-Ditylum_brightwellii.AAC.1